MNNTAIDKLCNRKKRPMIWLNQRDNSELNRCNNSPFTKATQSVLQNVTNIKFIMKCDSMFI